MRYRQLTPSGDSTFCSGNTNFLVNSPAAVAQLVMTRLNLWQGQWFLDQTVGTPWMQQVVGTGTQNVRDVAIQNVITGTPGVNAILSYSSILTGRALAITCNIDTIYGSTQIVTTL